MTFLMVSGAACGIDCMSSRTYMCCVRGRLAFQAFPVLGAGRGERAEGGADQSGGWGRRLADVEPCGILRALRFIEQPTVRCGHLHKAAPGWP